MIPKPLPENFLAKQPITSWQEILFGYEKGWVGWRSVVSRAEFSLKTYSNPNPSLVELAGLTKENVWKASELMKVLTKSEDPESAIKIKEKWLFVFLTWAYENRTQLDDPFRCVEVIYADFDYPSQIAGFVAFMPPADGWRPQDHSKEENHNRILRLWREYLEAQGRIYSDAS